MFTIERTTTKYELNFDESKVNIILVASENTRDILESENEITKKYRVLNSSNGYFKREHGSVYIKAYLVERMMWTTPPLHHLNAKEHENFE